MSLRESDVGKEMSSIQVPHELPSLISRHSALGKDGSIHSPANDAHAGIIEGEEAAESRGQVEDEGEDDEPANIADLARRQALIRKEYTS